MARAYLVEISISFVEVDSKTAPTCREVLQFVRDEDGAEYCCIDDDEEGCTCWNRREIIQDPHHWPSSVKANIFHISNCIEHGIKT